MPRKLVVFVGVFFLLLAWVLPLRAEEESISVAQQTNGCWVYDVADDWQIGNWANYEGWGNPLSGSRVWSVPPGTFGMVTGTVNLNKDGQPSSVPSFRVELSVKKLSANADRSFVVSLLKEDGGDVELYSTNSSSLPTEWLGISGEGEGRPQGIRFFSDGRNDMVVMDNIKITLCYPDDPDPTPTPEPEPQVPETAWISLPPAEVVDTGLVDRRCQEVFLAAVQGGMMAGVAEVQEPQFGPPLSIQDCVSPSRVSFGGPAFCLNPRRTLVVRDINDPSRAWTVRYSCDEQSGPVVFGAVSTADTTGISALVVFAAAAAWWANQPTTVEMVWRPLGEGMVEGGKVIAQTWEEAEDFILSLSQKPTTVHFGSPLVYQSLIDGEEVAATLRLYRTPSIELWDQQVWFYNASDRKVDADTVAVLQFLGQGGQGMTLYTYILTSRPQDGLSMGLWDTVSHLISFGYEVPAPLPGVRSREGSHSSDGDPLATARKDAMWYTVLNWAKTWTDAGFRPPWDWCGYRPPTSPQGEACACVSFSQFISRMVVNGAGELVEKVTSGIAILLNGNPTVVGGYRPVSPGAAPMSEGMRPVGNGNTFSSTAWQTINPDDPGQKDMIDRCPDDLGLKLPSAS